MLLSEMLSEVQDQIGDASIDSKIVRWLNMEQDYLISCYRFPLLEKQATVPTVAGTQNYLFTAFTPAITDLSYPKEMWIPSLPRKLYPIDEGDLSESEPQWNTLRGTIYRYIFRGTSVDFWRVPDGVFTIYLTYFRKFTALNVATPSQVSEVPYQWHPLLVQRGIVRGMRSTGHPDYPREQAIQDQMMEEFKKNVYSRPDVTHVLSGPELRRTMRKPNRPTLPPNYPR